jgi:hypothetical protein
MKKISIRPIIWSILLLSSLFVSCSSDNDCACPDTDTTQEEVRFTDVSDTILINTKDIEVGKGDDMVYSKTSSIIAVTGRTNEVTLDCYGMSAAAVKNGEMDTTRTVKNVTLINKGTINIHTKDLVEKYKSQIRTPTDTTPKYYYIRFIAMYAGKNSRVINDGVINVYYDHDPNTEFTVYSIALTADEGSTIQNNGEIHFYGNGSPRTRIRGFASMKDDITEINYGTMTADVEMAEDSRMITTGGNRNNVINNGLMKMHVSGKEIGMTRFGDSNLINNGTIDITSVEMPAGHASVLYPFDMFVCGMYEPFSVSRSDMPPIINRGSISIKMESAANSNPAWQGYGMYFEFINKADWLVTNIVNDGQISTSQTGPVHFNMAEAGFGSRTTGTKDVIHAKMGRWQTNLRDFSTTHDLFLAKGVNMDFSGGQLVLTKGDDYVDGTAYSVAPEALLHCVAPNSFVCTYSGYDDMTIITKDAKLTLNWDKVNKTASLKSN